MAIRHMVSIGFILWLSLAASAEDQPAPADKSIVEITPQLHMDLKNKEVILDAEVVLTEGPLELLLCPRRTKEHESILAAEVDPRSFQLALISVGAEPGSPAQIEPEYKPATGQKLKIEVEWEYDGKTKRQDAREWIRSMAENSDKPRPMSADFVFAGSRFIRVPGESRARWLGDEGDLVCVSNFPGSVIDVSIKSDSADASRLFEAWTERIPPKGTKVRVYFKPVKDEKE